ncbi:hypothetical protein [Microbacterium ulmi]|uniref:Asp23/Gls24 family envelope stress response protein n=1 Tax=Microbacterium ulmi TaxID=179095 RepID=A0A7Y2LXU2_9MICO|nr:hypothetical protein [Microbacterium ulmi]NII70703.1 hypothetical protein [Microbacterium ulmi]NNH02722.1 hypothetical protein [Microbacterium ulmi]
MSAARHRQAATAVEAAVRATPGVSEVYRSGSLVSSIVDAGARLIGLRGDAPLVVIDGEGANAHVAVSIGVDAASGAAQTCRAVHAAVAESLPEHGLSGAVLSITVAHVVEEADIA